MDKYSIVAESDLKSKQATLSSNQRQRSPVQLKNHKPKMFKPTRDGENDPYQMNNTTKKAKHLPNFQPEKSAFRNRKNSIMERVPSESSFCEIEDDIDDNKVKSEPVSRL